MKHTKLRACAVALLATMATACEITDPFKDVKVSLNFEATPVQVAAEIVDAATGEPLNVQGTRVEVQGAPAGAVVDAAGEPITTLDGAAGFVSFGLKNLAPTPEAPVTLTLVVDAPGYLTTSQKLVLNTEKSAPVRIAIVNPDNPPAGTAAVSDRPVGTGTSGAVATTTTITTPTESQTGGISSVTYPAGTVARDAAGNALTGQLTAEVVYFNNQDERSLEAFPGGLQATVGGAAAEEVTFVSGGFAAFELKDAQGRQARNFTQPVELSIDVPAGTIHPELGRAVQAGDTIPYWSFEPENGAWKYEGTGTLEANSRGSFTVRFNATHFSYYNLDWFYSASCRTSQRVTITNAPKDVRYLPLALYDARTGQLMKRARPSIADGWVQFNNAPQNRPVRIVASHPMSGEELGSQEFSNLCAGGTIALETPAPTITVTVDVRGTCPNGIEVRPTIPTWVRPQGGSWRFAGYLTRGQGQIAGLLPGTTYDVYGYVYLKDGWRSDTVQYRAGMDPENIVMNVDLPASAC